MVSRAACNSAGVTRAALPPFHSLSLSLSLSLWGSESHTDHGPSFPFSIGKPSFFQNKACFSLSLSLSLCVCVCVQEGERKRKNSYGRLPFKAYQAAIWPPSTLDIPSQGVDPRKDWDWKRRRRECWGGNRRDKCNTWVVSVATQGFRV